jgi:hypothetical protein
LPTFVEIATEGLFRSNLLMFDVELVVVKNVLFATEDAGEGVGVALTVSTGDGVGEGVGVGVTTGVGVGVGVATGVGAGVGVATGVGVTDSLFAPGNVIAKRVVPAKKFPPSKVKVSLATSPIYSLKTAPLPSSNTRTETFASPTKTLIRPSAPEHPVPMNCGNNVLE